MYSPAWQDALSEPSHDEDPNSHYAISTSLRHISPPSAAVAGAIQFPRRSRGELVAWQIDGSRGGMTLSFARQFNVGGGFSTSSIQAAPGGTITCDVLYVPDDAVVCRADYPGGKRTTKPAEGIAGLAKPACSKRTSTTTIIAPPVSQTGGPPVGKIQYRPA